MADLRVRVGGRGRSQIMAPGAGSSGEEGVWEDRTPAGLLGGFGPQVIFAHPTSSNIIYAYGGDANIGVYRSTDYGYTYARHSQVGAYVDTGKIWAGAIAPDASRLLAAANDFDTNRFRVLYSDDGGVTWSRTAELGAEPYSFHYRPGNSSHVVFGCHDVNKMFESEDGGLTWADKGAVGTSDVSGYAFLLDATTALYVNQGDNGSGQGTWRGTKSGSTWSWSKVSNQQHWHGSCQIFIDAVYTAIYLPGAGPSGAGGIEMSIDNGINWSEVSASVGGSCIGTPSTLYSSYGYPNLGSFGPGLQDAPRSPRGSAWSDRSTPSGMGQGAAMHCTTFDGINHIVLSVNWNEGLWRLKEAA